MKKTLLFVGVSAISLCASGQVLPNGKPDINFLFQQPRVEVTEISIDENSPQYKPLSEPNKRPAANSGALVTYDNNGTWCSYEDYDSNGKLIPRLLRKECVKW